MQQVTDIFNRVEDEMTSIPYDSTFPLNDGRMYPPQPDSKGRQRPHRRDPLSEQRAQHADRRQRGDPDHRSYFRKRRLRQAGADGHGI